MCQLLVYLQAGTELVGSLGAGDVVGGDSVLSDYEPSTIIALEDFGEGCMPNHDIPESHQFTFQAQLQSVASRIRGSGNEVAPEFSKKYWVC